MLTLLGRKVRLDRIAFSPDGRHLAALAEHGIVQVWDVAQRQVTHTRSASYYSSATASIFFSRVGDELAVQTAFTLSIYDLEGRRPPYAPAQRECSAAALSPSGRHLCLVSRHAERITCYALADFEPVWTRTIVPPSGHLALGFVSLAYSADGTTLAAGSTHYDAVLILDGRSGEVRRQLGHPVGPGVRTVALSPDGRLAAWCAATHLHLWRLDPDRELAHHTLGKTHFFSVAFHPSGEFFATANGDGKVDYWDARTGAHRQAFDWQVGQLRDVIFDSTGDRAACCGKRGDIIVWDVDR
jgi:WD40 repeat protein